jgi:hypothetical protein
LAFGRAAWYASRQDSSFQLTKRASHLTTLNSKQPYDFQKDKTNNIKQEARLLTGWHSLIEEHPQRPKVPPQTTANHQEAKLLQAQDQRHQSLVQIITRIQLLSCTLTTNACQSHLLFPLSSNIDPIIHASSIHGCAPADTLISRLVILKSICGLYTPCVSTACFRMKYVRQTRLKKCHSFQRVAPIYPPYQILDGFHHGYGSCLNW